MTTQTQTPCPTRPSTSVTLPRSLTLTRSPIEERTEECDYTTELRAALRQAAARRCGTRRRESVTVFEDGGAESHDIAKPESGDADAGIGRDGRVTTKGADSGHMSIPASYEARVSTRVDADTSAVETVRDEMKKLRKEPRRRTIYVPSEDTTILTIHPGVGGDRRMRAFRPETIPSDRLGRTGTADTRKEPRMSLATAPKRVPLKSALRVVQECGEGDRMGMGGGKENVPPGGLEVFEFGKRKEGVACMSRGTVGSSMKPGRVSAKGAKMLPVEGVAVQPKAVERLSGNGIGSSRLRSRGPTPANEPIEPAGYTKPKGQCSSILGLSMKPWNSAIQDIPYKLPTRLVPITIPHTIPISKPHYRLLQEDISRPELFEDTWLSDQESAITQLVNGLFEAASGKTPSLPDARETRTHFLSLYEEPSMVLLHKRLQASLLYGGLRTPKDSLAEIGRLTTDIGLRRRFVELWTKSYDTDALISAVEVVVGREIPSHPTSATSASPGDRPSKKRRRELERFLDVCLLQNEDLQPTYQTQSCNSLSTGFHASQDPQGKSSSHHRTALRSLMLIILLDRAKQSALVPSNLFRRAGPHKSSHAILFELSSLILPSLGDPTRTLTHLDYHLSHTQFPLDEYTYPIRNLAVDLRDGVRLTHIVELLLYPPTTLQAQRDDVTITMPMGEILTSAFREGMDSWVLSQHLKFPCLGRVQKMYNVQIALSALHGVKGIEHALEGLTAEDVVDGHREKSIKLLWGLVGKLGLATLVDFEDLKREIRRFQSRVVVGEEENGDERDCLRYQTSLLYAWARAVAARYGINVSNLTTSFADGVIFSKIVEEYSRYLPFSPSQSLSSSSSTTMNSSFNANTRGALDAQLRNIGCSTSFASLFSPGQASKVFDKDFTIAALAFLASRLLGMSKRGRTGDVIWGAWVRYQNRILTRRKCVLRNLARDCAMVVQTKEKVEKAAVILQGSVRMWLMRSEERRRLEEEWIRRLEETEVKQTMLDLQSRIRGWAARKRVDDLDIWLC